jgi:hypothetical protein
MLVDDEEDLALPLMENIFKLLMPIVILNPYKSHHHIY